MIYNFTLPLPPSVNQLYGGGSRQKRFPSKKYKEWLSKCPPLTKLNLIKVKVEYIFFFPTKRPADLDNRAKAVNDYLVKQGVLVDDNFNVIPELLLRFGGFDKKNARVEILLLTLEE